MTEPPRNSGQTGEDEEEERTFWQQVPFPQKSHHGILGITYHTFRFAQFATLVTIIGLVGKFIGDMNSKNINPPSLLVGIVSLVSLAALYIVVLAILFWDEKVNFTWPLVIDTAILAGLIAVAYIAGRPLSYLDCDKIGKTSSSTANSFIDDLANLSGSGKMIYSDFIGATREVCTEMKAIWGLVISDCVFFSFTVIAGILLVFLGNAKRVDKDDAKDAT